MSQSSSFGAIPKVLPEGKSEDRSEGTSGAAAQDASLRPRQRLVAAGLSLSAALLLGGTVLLWAHYGTTVFFETIRAGFTACFG